MKYDDLIDTLSERTREPKKTVREILDALPEALLELKAGEFVHTPLGAFTARYRKPRKVLLPDGIAHGDIEEAVVVRLNPSYRLRVSPGHSRWGFMTTPSPDSDS